MAAPTFDVLRPTITRVEKPTLPFAASLEPFADPTSALPVKLGEWLSRGGPGADELARPGIPITTEYGLPSFPYWEWTGQTDVQSSLKGTILLPIFEAWTMLWDNVWQPPTGYGDALCVSVANVGDPWAGYGVLSQRLALGFILGFATLPIPAAVGQRLYFRANF